MTRERFAPSPTGPLHLGHAFSALSAWDAAQAAGGEFILRIEDIDQSRARPEWEAQIFDDLSWLGLRWPAPVWRQSAHLAGYHAALNNLWEMGLLYVCTCSRRDIETALSAPQEGAKSGPDGPVYPGTCRCRERAGTMPTDAVLRLDMGGAVDALFKEFGTDCIRFVDLKTGIQDIRKDDLVDTCGDVVLARRNMGTSYHLSVVVDDAAQKITHVTRGEDLFEATKIHVVIQKLLGLPTPVYRHHRLIRDEAGRRLAKRDDARAIAKYRAEGITPDDIRRMVGLL